MYLFDDELLMEADADADAEEEEAEGPLRRRP